jgi:hypothetical protein
VDADTPPSPPPSHVEAPAPYVYAATDERPRTPREKELCKTAGTFDWLYWGTTVALATGAVLLDQFVLQSAPNAAERLTGPALIGLTWGGVLGGGYLALPKCEPGLVRSPNPDGDAHPAWPAAIAIALLAGATAPLLVGIETGTGAVTTPWSTAERTGRLVTAGVAGAGGALLPYLIPPKTWRAAKELQKIRVGAVASMGTAPVSGAVVSYTVRF